MAYYLISFEDGAMTFPQEDLAEVANAAHAVMRDAQNAGVWIFGGGLHSAEFLDVVNELGVVNTHPVTSTHHLIGGFSILNVASRNEVIEWSGKIAAACRCPQTVREIMDDPEAHTPR
jgi:hypothetical protein